MVRINNESRATIYASAGVTLSIELQRKLLNEVNEELSKFFSRVSMETELQSKRDAHDDLLMILCHSEASGDNHPWNELLSGVQQKCSKMFEKCDSHVKSRDSNNSNLLLILKVISERHLEIYLRFLEYDFTLF